MVTKRTSKKKSDNKKSTSRKYSPAAGKIVETEMRAMKRGKLKSGRSGKKVTNPKQAIAIGLSEARKEGKKVPASKIVMTRLPMESSTPSVLDPNQAKLRPGPPKTLP